MEVTVQGLLLGACKLTNGSVRVTDGHTVTRAGPWISIDSFKFQVILPISRAFFFPFDFDFLLFIEVIMWNHSDLDLHLPSPTYLEMEDIHGLDGSSAEAPKRAILTSDQ